MVVSRRFTLSSVIDRMLASLIANCIRYRFAPRPFDGRFVVRSGHAGRHDECLLSGVGLGSRRQTVKPPPLTHKRRGVNDYREPFWVLVGADLERWPVLL